MSRAELIAEIERLRAIMYMLAPNSQNFRDLLDVSKQLDELIVEYQQTT